MRKAAWIKAIKAATSEIASMGRALPPKHRRAKQYKSTVRHSTPVRAIYDPIVLRSLYLPPSGLVELGGCIGIPHVRAPTAHIEVK
jgi:hypothetical protein